MRRTTVLSLHPVFPEYDNNPVYVNFNQNCISENLSKIVFWKIIMFIIEQFWAQR